MSNIYMVIRNDGKKIGIHEDKSVVKKFRKSLIDKERYLIVKIHNGKKIKNSPYYLDLYLEPCGRVYLPSIYTTTKRYFVDDVVEDYRISIMTLQKELMQKSVSKSKKRSIQKTLLYLSKKLEKLEIEEEKIDMDGLIRLHDQMDHYRQHVY